MKTLKEINGDYLDNIISVAYGDAGLIDKIKIYFDARRNPAVKKILNEYRETANKVHMIQPEEFIGKLPVKGSGISNWLLNYLYIFFREPIISTAIALMIIASITGYFITNTNHKTTGYSNKELMIADQQAKETFALVASIFDRTKDELKYNIINDKINKPINKGLIIVNKYL
jgi:hypothetical protein